MGEIILLWNTFKLLLKGYWLTVLKLQQYVCCITIYLRILAFKVGELNFFTRRIKTYRWKEMILWVHEMALTTKSEEATCYSKSGTAGFSKDSVSELFNLLERTGEPNVNCITIYV
jgi:hypothetical protein